MALSRDDILAGLRKLGLNLGDRVLVHSSMAALGKVDGGPATVIDALVEAVGKDGLVMVPTFGCKPPFDRKTSGSPLGAIADQFWRRPDAVRSLHPTHSVAAIGRGAEELLSGHEKAPTAYAEGTPYHTLAVKGGKILLLGVDQDRNTTLHTAEALSGAAYLTDITGTYVDDNGEQVTIPVAAMAGPHRDFIGLDRLFREHGIMTIGGIGGAVCRLIDAGQMLKIAVEALKRDPAAVLCDNPLCADCQMQRGKIKAARLAAETFTLAAVAQDISHDPAVVLEALQAEGIHALEITAEEYPLYRDLLSGEGLTVAAVRAETADRQSLALAAELRVPIVVPVADRDSFDGLMSALEDNGAQAMMMNAGERSSFYERLYADFPNAPALAFDASAFAKAGEKPFLEVFYRGKLRKQMRHFYIADGDWRGCGTLPGYGNGEVKEIISMLRCRSYSGVMTLRSPHQDVDSFRLAARAFWDLLDNM